MMSSERRLGEKLGIPDNAASVIGLDQSCHMDWEWLDLGPVT
jgi:hypothetical protein